VPALAASSLTQHPECASAWSKRRRATSPAARNNAAARTNACSVGPGGEPWLDGSMIHARDNYKTTIMN
jgi:hypothetical protein